MRTLLLPLLLAPALVLAQDPNAPPPPAKKPPTTGNQVYKWVDDKGVVHYGDKPSADNAKPAKLPPLQTYKGGTKPNLSRFDKPAPGPGARPGAAHGASIDIVTPARDETFRGGERTVPVAVVVTPALADGQRLVYLLDGTPQASPTSDTSFALTNVDRGSHTVSVTLVDTDGNPIGTSPAVTFHVQPPIAGRAQSLQPKPKKP